MELSLKEKGEQCFDQVFCKKLAKHFNYSKGGGEKPIVKWTEVLKWLQSRHRYILSQDTSDDPLEEIPVVLEEVPVLLEEVPVVLEEVPVVLEEVPVVLEEVPVVQEARIKNGENEISQAHEDISTSNIYKMKFEARSSKDEAWYDIESFIAHRFLSSGGAEVYVRFVGFGPEEDEWVDVRKAVRERSITLENNECNKVQIGDVVLCFQVLKEDVAQYHDARVIEIQRRSHDIRGCRCCFTVRYERDNLEESVPLKKLCFRPSILGHSGNTSS